MTNLDVIVLKLKLIATLKIVFLQILKKMNYILSWHVDQSISSKIEHAD